MVAGESVSKSRQHNAHRVPENNRVCIKRHMIQQRPHCLAHTCMQSVTFATDVRMCHMGSVEFTLLHRLLAELWSLVRRVAFKQENLGLLIYFCKSKIYSTDD